MDISKYIGNYKGIYVCKSNNKDILNKSSSGGVATESLVYALKKNIVDAAIVVGMSKKKPWKCKVFLAKNSKEIISAAGSKYSTINLRDFLKIAEKNSNLKLAMVGLPCHVAAIRKMQNKGMYKNIRLLIGLFCGYNMAFNATEFVIRKLRINKNKIKSLEYRGGDYPGGMLIRTNKKRFFLPKGYYDFLNLVFVLKGCIKCTYYTNEFADISIGDAWNWGKSSAVIERTDLGKKILENPSISKIKIDEKEFLRMHIHNIKHKKEGDSLSIRVIMFIAKKIGKVVPLFLILPIIKIRKIKQRRWSTADVSKSLNKIGIKKRKINPRKLNRIIKTLKIKENSKILDYSIGNPCIIKNLANKNSKFTILDVSDKMLNIKSRIFESKKIDFKKKLIKTANLPIKENIFDFSFCFETLEHLPHPEMAVRELARVTKKHGKIIIMNSSVLSILKMPYCFISRKEMIKYIKGAGMKVKSITPFKLRKIFLCEKT